MLEEFSNYSIHILNGHLFAFVGIIDLLRIEDSTCINRDEIVKFHDVFLEASTKLIERMNMPFWSKHSAKEDLFPNIASKFYHDAHIEQLRGLYQLTGRVEFQEYAEL